MTRFDPPESPDADLRPPVPLAPSLPPDDRIKREGMHFALYIVLFVGSLLANKWEIPHAPDMSTVAFTILGINAALRKGEHKDR